MLFGHRLRRLALIAPCSFIVMGLGVAGDRHRNPSSAPLFRPFDVSSIKIVTATPSKATTLDRRVFKTLTQKEDDLVICPWKDRGLEQARLAAKQLGLDDVAPQSGNSRVGPLIGGLFKPLIRVYYGKIDKDDLWISKYWGGGAFTTVAKSMPRSMIGMNLYGQESSLDKEQIRTDFRNPKSVLIEYRSNPDDGGLDSIVFLADASLVKYKELYGAAQQYCKFHTQSDEAVTIGWKRFCQAGSQVTPSIKTSGISNDVDTVVLIGFACGAPDKSPV